MEELVLDFILYNTEELQSISQEKYNYVHNAYVEQYICTHSHWKKMWIQT